MFEQTIPSNNELLIKAEELSQLYQFLGEIPNKFAEPIKGFFASLYVKRAKEVATAQAQEAKGE